MGKYLQLQAISILLAITCLNFTNSDDPSVEGDCETLLKRFANHTGDFVRCAISNIRPIRMCTSCVQQYTDVLVDHDIILHVNDANETCKDKYIDIDRVQIVEEALKYVTGLWKQSYCDNCLTKNSDGSLRITNVTSAFLDAYDDTEGCFDLNNETTVCANCTPVYFKLNSFYESIKDQYGDGQMCMDVVDSMNRTRNEWNTELHCKKLQPRLDTALLTSCGIVLSLPIFFYLALWQLSQAQPAPVSVGARLVEMWRARANSFARRNTSHEPTQRIINDDASTSHSN